MRHLRQAQQIVGHRPGRHRKERSLKRARSLTQRVFRSQGRALGERRQVADVSLNGMFNGGTALVANGRIV